MSMQEFRRMAARIDQQMGLLATQGVVDEHTILNRMMGCVPDLHQIWTGTSDKELVALSSEFPGFYRYAFIMEEAFEAERRKASRPYDKVPELPEHHKQTMEAILTNSATLERGYQAFLQSGCPTALRPQVMELNRLHRAWFADIAAFTNVLLLMCFLPRVLEFSDPPHAPQTIALCGIWPLYLGQSKSAPWVKNTSAATRIIQSATNRCESFNKFAQWVYFATDLIQENVRDEQLKVIKYNHLIANLLIFHNCKSMTQALKELQDEGMVLTPDILRALSPYRQHASRFGTYELRVARRGRWIMASNLIWKNIRKWQHKHDPL